MFSRSCLLNEYCQTSRSYDWNKSFEETVTSESKKKLVFRHDLNLIRQWTNIYVQLIDAQRPVIGRIKDDEVTIL